ncbi:heme-binding protein [Lacihabitans sp. LS3-19]|uniref:SOUL family heme-binding protein n=1 Tax=Lacihabitans sp. LS3-19 TaxID=2487335 RepID=UPI0020CC3D96|nr:heme-binding protein [Lacihabitans sp. LS3-19]
MFPKDSRTQAYDVVKKSKDFEIRYYPSVTMATINSSAKTYKELGNSGFRKLAGYIFGGNVGKVQIAMTSPVHMDINDLSSSMSFVMPMNFNKSNLPKPNNQEVNISTTTEEYVAAIQFNGYASDKDIKLYTEKLENSLKAASISYYGHFRFLGYNAPYQFFGRRNEIIVSVNWDKQ